MSAKWYQTRSQIAALAAVLLSLPGALIAGELDVCIHVSGGCTGRDTVVIGFTNKLEIWLTNTWDWITAHRNGFEINSSAKLNWDMEYGSRPPVNEEGPAMATVIGWACRFLDRRPVSRDRS